MPIRRVQDNDQDMPYRQNKNDTRAIRTLPDVPKVFASRTTKSTSFCLFALFVAHRLFEALAALGGFFLFALNALGLKETTPAHFGQNAVLLDFFVEAFQCRFKRFILVNDDLSHK